MIHLCIHRKTDDDMISLFFSFFQSVHDARPKRTSHPIHQHPPPKTTVGVKDGAIFGAGVLGSLLYLLLLQLKADSFGGAAALDGNAEGDGSGSPVAGKVRWRGVRLS